MTAPPTPTPTELNQPPVTPTTPTPPTPPKDSPTKDELLQIYQTTASEASRRVQELEAELRTARSAPARSDAPQIDELNKRFLDQPVTILNDLVTRAIAPLTKEVDNINRERQLMQLKNRYRADPRFKPVFDKAEHMIDQAMLANPNMEMNDANLISTIAGIRGAADMGLIPGLTITTAAPPVPTNVPQAHLTPSAPASPTPAVPENKLRELTEMEKQIARSRGWTDEQYLKLIDLPPEAILSGISTVLKKPEAPPTGGTK